MTAADLNRWFCEAWCPRCGFDIPWDQCDGKVCRCNTTLKPGLHTRCPEAVVGIKYDEGHDAWIIPEAQSVYGTYEPTFIGTDWAADLLVMGVVREQPPQTVGAFMTEVGWLMLREKYSMPEAVATAMHRAADSLEGS